MAFDFIFGNRPRLGLATAQGSSANSTLSPLATVTTIAQTQSPNAARRGSRWTAEEELPSLIPLFLPFALAQAQSKTGELAVPEALSMNLMACRPHERSLIDEGGMHSR
jgi:hypothetical protein